MYDDLFYYIIKVSLIGFSNWVLEPDKMNRCLFVARGEPHITELIRTARGLIRVHRDIVQQDNQRLPAHCSYAARHESSSASSTVFATTMRSLRC